MIIYIVTADAVTDVSGELLDSGFVAGAFNTIEGANFYIDNVTETYMHKKRDYTISEVELS